MPHSHAVVWLDHAQARLFHLGRDEAEKTVLHSTNRHVHHKSGAIGSGREPADAAFFHDVATALQDAREILVVGPGAAKLEFVRYLAKAHAALEDKVLGCETVDHPTDGQLLAYARKYFHAKDRMLPLRVSA